MEIKRDIYLNRVINGMGNGMIKIVTGLRRCGKSYLLSKLFVKHLLKIGIFEDHIITIALDDLVNEQYRNPHKLLEYIKTRIISDDMYYVILDEVQLVDRFAEMLNSLLHISNIDIYVTGSNSRFLSTDIVTEFRGRGDEIHIYPLSFSEYFSAVGGDKYEAWSRYAMFGGLPQIVKMKNAENANRFLSNIYNTVYIRDLVERYKIGKVAEFESLLKVMASSIGAPCNPGRIANTFKSVVHAELHANTISTYLKYMEEAFLLENSVRYDVKGRKYIGALSKYYFTDMGIRNAVLGFRQFEETHLMENIIYNELCIRGFTVDVGVVEVREREGNTMKRKQLEVDFVANKGSKRYYIQSAFAIPDSEKMAQESASLKQISDTFRKVIIIKDNIMSWHTDEGILVISLFDFLLNPSSLDF